MKKIKLFCVLCVLVLACFLINRCVVEFIWVNPNTNTETFPFIAKTIKVIDNAIKDTIFSMNSNQNRVKLLYINGYGSGFVQNNPIPNDLDYSVGVYLGKLKFNGENQFELASEIYTKMLTFESQLIYHIDKSAKRSYFTDYNPNVQPVFTSKNSEKNIELISQSIPKLILQKDYIVYTKKTFIDKDKKEVPVLLPFVLKKNEILIENYSPKVVFSKSVKYGPKTRKYIREISIISDFYFDLQYGNEIIPVEVVAESFNGQRLQLGRRFFTPLIFTANLSANFLKSYPLLLDDEKYIEYRLLNFRRHLQEFSNLKQLNENPVKLLKRLLQCRELILPVLAQEKDDEIKAIVNKNLNLPIVQLINDYRTAYKNLWQITASFDIFSKAKLSRDLSLHVEEILNISNEIYEQNVISKEDVSAIKKYNSILDSQLDIIDSPEKLQKYNKLLAKNMNSLFPLLDRIILNNLYNKDKIYAYVDEFNSIMSYAGFHTIEICWIDKDLIGVVKDDFTSLIPEQDLKKMALENNLADVNYKFIEDKKVPLVKYSIWVRYNSTEEENLNWAKIRMLLLQDKKNFNIKREFDF